MSDNGNSDSGIDKASAFASYEGIRKRLRVLHDSDGLSWPQIAARSEYLPIPLGTLYGIYCGKKIPKKWHEKLNYPPPRSPRIAVSKTDMKRAAASIMNNVDPELVKELVELLK
ncbi:MAG: hypothetical protein ACYSYU_10950 [Planctomycetota bacterium]